MSDAELSELEEKALAELQRTLPNGAQRPHNRPRCARCNKQVERFYILPKNSADNVLVAICHGAREVVRVSDLLMATQPPGAMKFGDAFRDAPALPPSQAPAVRCINSCDFGDPLGDRCIRCNRRRELFEGINRPPVKELLEFRVHAGNLAARPADATRGLLGRMRLGEGPSRAGVLAAVAGACPGLMRALADKEERALRVLLAARLFPEGCPFSATCTPKEAIAVYGSLDALEEAHRKLLATGQWPPAPKVAG